jgi:hypothetical protein
MIVNNCTTNYYWEDGSCSKGFTLYKTIHRENSPAIITTSPDGTPKREGWYIKGMKHRIDGPAVVWYDNDGFETLNKYYLYDIFYTEEEYYKHPEVVEYIANKLINQELSK